MALPGDRWSSTLHPLAGIRTSISLLPQQHDRCGCAAEDDASGGVAVQAQGGVVRCCWMVDEERCVVRDEDVLFGKQGPFLWGGSLPVSGEVDSVVVGAEEGPGAVAIVVVVVFVLGVVRVADVVKAPLVGDNTRGPLLCGDAGPLAANGTLWCMWCGLWITLCGGLLCSMDGDDD